MHVRKSTKYLLIGLAALVVFFFLYSIFFRSFLNSQQYLEIAYDYTNRDPHILNWQEPEFEIITHKGILAIHMVFHTDQDDTKGPWSLYIDPIRKKVFDEDPRR